MTSAWSWASSIVIAGIPVVVATLATAKFAPNFLGKETQKDFYLMGCLSFLIGVTFWIVDTIYRPQGTLQEIFIWATLAYGWLAIACAQILFNRCLFALWRKIRKETEP
jgi:hypothetical protein